MSAITSPGLQCRSTVATECRSTLATDIYSAEVADESTLWHYHVWSGGTGLRTSRVRVTRTRSRQAAYDFVRSLVSRCEVLLAAKVMRPSRPRDTHVVCGAPTVVGACCRHTLSASAAKILHSNRVRGGVARLACPLNKALHRCPCRPPQLM